MRDTDTAPTFDVLARRALACLVLAGALPALAARIPQPVSPGALSAGAVAEARCPTFLWAGVSGARAYELTLFRFSDDGAEPALVTRVSVPGEARGWTPPVRQCLERGQRYAWSVAVAGAEPSWSAPFLFEIEAAPSLEEVEQAIATLQRYREHQLGDESPSAASAIAAADVPEPLDGGSSRAPLRTRERPSRFAADRPLPGAALTSPTSGVVRVASAATPTLDGGSLKVSASIALGASSNLFKDEQVFLWDDTSGNTALGRHALASASGSATHNTAVGREALQNTTDGGSAIEGSYNTAVGDRALKYNTTGNRNTASGGDALRSNTTGDRNTASGAYALHFNTTGNRNTASGFSALVLNFGNDNTASGTYALRDNSSGDGNTASGYLALSSNTTGNFNTASGHRAFSSRTTGDRNTALGSSAGLFNTSGNDSIFINNLGVVGDDATIRIGTQGTQTKTFIAGIRGATAGTNAIAVLIDSVGQLGTVASSRAVKQDIQDLGSLDERLLELRPVAFRYKQHVASDPETPLQFGLIAEEVAEVFPELVVYDEEGKPETVMYHLLSTLLLGEVQKQQGELRSIRARLKAVESQGVPAARDESGRGPRGR